ncbi:MAG: SIS domain-containing protein [Verrucomicrobiota bacterium]|nr:SIS domain-containing protein [Verrucomicrobiota bacterium]
MREAILHSVDEAIRAVSCLQTPEALDFIERSASILAECFRNGNKLLVCGNGGSLCDAMHFAEELTGFYRTKRPALPAISLADPAHITCVGNDVGYEYVFSRGIEAHGKKGDVLALLTTSGNSRNLVSVVEIARARGLTTIAFLGKNGGKLKGQADLEWVVSGFPWSDRIQEAHMTAIHIIIEQMERQLFAHHPSYAAAGALV